MKMKKLLSMGALALVIASSTSVASFAAVNTSTLTSDQVLTGNQVQVLTVMLNALGDDKNANANNIVDTTKVKEYAKNHEGANKLADSLGLYGTGTEKVNDNAYETLNQILVNCPTDESFNDFKKQVNEVAEHILAYDDNTKEMDTATQEKRATEEKKVQNLLKDKDYTISFGRNSKGVTTVCVEKKGNVILQVSRDEVENLKNTLNSSLLDRQGLVDFLTANNHFTAK